MGFCQSKIQKSTSNNRNIGLNKIGNNILASDILNLDEYRDNKKIEKIRENIEKEVICRICYEGLYLENFCKCKGSCKWMHRDCLLKWIKVSGNIKCLVCKEIFNIKSKKLDSNINCIETNLNEGIDREVAEFRERNRRVRQIENRRIYNDSMRVRNVENMIERIGYGPILIGVPGIVNVN